MELPWGLAVGICFNCTCIIVFNQNLFGLSPTRSDQNPQGLQARIYLKFQLVWFFEIPRKFDACLCTTGACPAKLPRMFGPSTPWSASIYIWWNTILNLHVAQSIPMETHDLEFLIQDCARSWIFNSANSSESWILNTGHIIVRERLIGIQL